MNDVHKNNSCYDKSTWLSYQTGTLVDSKRAEMEEHLLHCDVCMEIYLGIVETSLISTEEYLLGEDFTDHVMKRVEAEITWQKASVTVVNISEKRRREHRKNKATLLLTYCAAASIAMFFWVGGYFNGLSETVVKGIEYIPITELSEQPEYAPSKGLIQTGWTKKVMNEKRTSLFENIMFNMTKE